MSDFWSVLLALLAIVLPLALAWLLLGPTGHKRASSAPPRDPDKR